MADLFLSEHERWLTDIIENHHEEALKRVSSLLDEAIETEDGCMILGGNTRRKVRFRGGQSRAYRFIYCVTHRAVAGFDEVVRHRCHNPLCVNPDHLELGSRAENKQDDWDRDAYGIDIDLL